MTCNNCIHYEVCQHMYNVCLKMGINYFKDKSKYIELPCKVGDTVYVLPTATNSLKEITPYKVIDFILAKWNIVSIVSADKKNKLYQPHLDDFGKTVFLTLEEAEEKLKELNKNG